MLLGIVWLMGVGIYWIQDMISFRNNIIRIISPIFLVLAMAFAKYKVIAILTPELNDIIVGLAFCIVLIAYHDVDIRNLWLKRISVYLSDISYTLYICHFPFLMLLFVVALNQGQHQFNLLGNLTFYGVVIASIVLSTLMWFIFERNTYRIRKWLTGFFSQE